MDVPLNSVSAEQTLIELGGVPVNRIAWRVISPGEHYEKPVKLRLLCFDNPPPMIKITHNQKSYKTQVTCELYGVRAGRLTVIGYWGRRKDFNPNQKEGGLENQYWVCRCLCGLFTIRTAKAIVKRAAIQSPDNDKFPLMCDVCAIAHVEKFGVPHEEARAFIVQDQRKLLSRERAEQIVDLVYSRVNYTTAKRSLK